MMERGARWVGPALNDERRQAMVRASLKAVVDRQSFVCDTSTLESLESPQPAEKQPETGQLNE